MKKISIIQPGFLPWLGYFEQMALTDVFVYLDDVQYTKQDWRNRNVLKSPSGRSFITVPVKKTSNSEILINEIDISYSQPWQKKMIRKIIAWYSKAPFFNEFFPSFIEVLEGRFERLVDLNYALIDLIRQIVGIKTPLFKSSDIPNKSQDKNMKLIDICKYHEVNLLYDGYSAQGFINGDLFKKYNINLQFQDYEHKNYPQQWGRFESHLSIIDLILNCGPESENFLLANSEKIKI